MKHDTAGDPITGLKWTHRTTAKIAEELRTLGIDVSANTVAKLLGGLGFSLRVNHKKKSNGSHQQRDEQFANIKVLRQRCVAKGIPLARSARTGLAIRWTAMKPSSSISVRLPQRPDSE